MTAVQPASAGKLAIAPMRAPIRASEASRSWAIGAALVGLVTILPVVAVVAIAVASSGDNIWPHLVSTVLPSSLATTLILIAGTGATTLVIGTAAAWVITMYRFPGRAIADRLLVLPLAMPTYILAFAFVELLDYAGPVQSGLRAALGYKTPADYMFPDIRSLLGAVFVFSCALYPYVYLTARAGFEQQSVCALDVARTLGRTAGGAFWSVGLPMARPALAAGCAFVAMECLNDIGAVQYLGVETLTASIYATWVQRGSLGGASQIASVMMTLILALFVVERLARGASRFHGATGRMRAVPFEQLTGWRGYACLMALLTPVIIAFVLPFSLLAIHAGRHAGTVLSSGYLLAAKNSLMLASLTALIAVAVALFLSYGVRVARSRVTVGVHGASSFGYALPGTVLAIGVLIPLGMFDNSIDRAMRAAFGISTGLLLSGTIAALTIALVIRFLAVALGPIDAGLTRISPNLDAASRTLGMSALETLSRVHLPLITPALGAAALLVFVDTLKELPATLLLRPFNFETLATYVYGLAAVEQFEEAAVGAVTIVLIGLLPMLLLHRAVASGRSPSSPPTTAMRAQ